MPNLLCYLCIAGVVNFAIAASFSNTVEQEKKIEHSISTSDSQYHATASEAAVNDENARGVPKAADGEAEQSASYGRSRQRRDAWQLESAADSRRENNDNNDIFDRRLPPRVDNYEHLNNWDGARRRYGKFDGVARALVGRNQLDDNNDGAVSDNLVREHGRPVDDIDVPSWQSGREGRHRFDRFLIDNDSMLSRSLREFDSIGGGLVIPDKRYQGLESLNGEVDENDRRSARSFDSLGGGLIVPSKRYKELEDAEFSRTDTVADTNREAMAPVRRSTFDSLGGGLIPAKRITVGSRSADYWKKIDNFARDASVGSSGGFETVQRRTFDSLGGGLVLPEKRHERDAIVDDELRHR